MDRCKVGVIGCGDISRVYLHSLTQVFRNTQVVAVSSRGGESARRRAAEFGSPYAVSTEELLAMELDIVVILTDPASHFRLAEQALLAGKHTYVEKPLAATTAEAGHLLALAREKKLMLTCAPDTLLGGGIQTCRKLIDNGLIGTPVASVGQTFNGGPESWHPNPFFLYQKGAGPLYDVGPYYIGGILYLLGPAGEVACMAKKTYAQRTIGSQPHCGEKIDVEMPTYYACTMHLTSGAICTSLHSFDVPCSRLDTRIEIYGTEGTLITAPPCDFSGEILFRGRNDSTWRQLPIEFPYEKNCRGVGVSDMADALIRGRAPRLAADFTYHTLDVIESLQRSGETGKFVPVTSRFIRTPPMPEEPLFSNRFSGLCIKPGLRK